MISVFIISSYQMFSLGLEKLLSQEKSFKVLGNETDAEQAIEQIKKYQPDVVILYRDDTHPNNSKALIIEILKANPNPNTKVIGLNLRNNIFFVYQATQWVTRDVADLIKAIKEKPLWDSQSSPSTPFNRSGHNEVGTGDNTRLTKH